MGKGPLYCSLEELTNANRFRDRVERAIEKLSGFYSPQVTVGVYETYRSQLVQDAYWARGRLPLNEVNDLYARAGLLAISDAMNQSTITNAKVSNHLSRRALDICWCYRIPSPNGTGGHPEAGTWQWNVGKHPAEWLAIGQYLEREIPAVWGGRWKRKRADGTYSLDSYLDPVSQEVVEIGWDPFHFEELSSNL